MCDNGGLMELPDHCKQCKQASDDCAILFRASKIQQIRKKRFLLKKCPCNSCIMIPLCKETCVLLNNYIKEKLPNTKLIGQYFHERPVNWLYKKGI